MAMHDMDCELLQYHLWKAEIRQINCKLPASKVQRFRNDALHLRKQELLAQCYEMEHRISLLPPFECTVLIERYINEADWQEIADKLGCSRDQTEWIHQRALRLYQRNVPFAGG